MIKLINEFMVIYKDGYLMLVGVFKHYIQFWVWELFMFILLFHPSNNI